MVHRRHAVLKSSFARFGIQDVVVSDNGSQLASREFVDVAGCSECMRSRGVTQDNVSCDTEGIAGQGRVRGHSMACVGRHKADMKITGVLGLTVVSCFFPCHVWLAQGYPQQTCALICSDKKKTPAILTALLDNRTANTYNAQNSTLL